VVTRCFQPNILGICTDEVSLRRGPCRSNACATPLQEGARERLVRAWHMKIGYNNKEVAETGKCKSLNGDIHIRLMKL
jgi:hypothetical protein